MASLVLAIASLGVAIASSSYFRKRQSHFPGDRTKIASYAKFINSDTLFKEVEYKQAFKIYLFQAFRI